MDSHSTKILRFTVIQVQLLLIILEHAYYCLSNQQYLNFSELVSVILKVIFFLYCLNLFFVFRFKKLGAEGELNRNIFL